MLKPVWADNLPDADNKSQTLVGKVGTRAFEPFKLFADFGVIDRLFAEQCIQFKLLLFDRIF